MANGRMGLLGGLAQGIEAGAGIAARAQQLGLLRQEQQARAEERDLQRSLAKFQVASTLITNKHLPASVKLQAFNEGIVGAWNTLFQGGPGSALPDNLLSPLSEWNDALTDYVKRGQKIMADKTLTPDQKLEGMRGLMVEAQEDVNLAPLVDQLKSQGEQKMQADTLRAVEILTTDGKVTDNEATEFATIRSRSPKAVLEAARIVDERRGRQLEQAKQDKPTKLDAFTDARGHRILVTDAGKVDLGPTQGSAAFSLGEFRAKLSVRANNLKTGDAKIDAMDPVVARRVLEDLNKTDFLTQLLRPDLGGTTPPRTAPAGGGAVSPEEEARKFLEGQ